MNLPQLSLHNYQFTLTAFVALFLVGLITFLSMPQREDPALDIPNVLVVAVYPGASPQDVESQVVDPIEEAIHELDDLEEVETTIRDGVAVTQVEFTFGVDVEDKFDEVQRQVNQVKDDLPADLYQLDVRKMSTNTVAIMQLALIGEVPPRLLKAEAERVKEVIETVGGVRKVEIEAYAEEEVLIALDPVKMTRMNISIDDVERAIQSSNANIPGGALKVSNKLFNIKTSGAYEDLEQIRNTVVGAVAGKIVYLKHIATIGFDYEEDRWRARYNGRPGLYITIQQKEGYNIFSITDPIKERLAATELAPGVELVSIFDQSLGVETRVDGFLNNLLQGIVLVGVIILLALGLRSASIVMLAIPLSILVGLFFVDRAGFALQQMSIAGLVVALGLLVDNSIAIIENIERYLALGYSRRDAAVKGAAQLMAPITSATLTTVLAFVPIVTMPDTTGAFIRALPVTVIATLLASLLIALTLTPLLSSRLLRERRRGAAAGQTRAFRALQRFVRGPYRRMLDWAFAHRYLTIGLALAMLFGAFALFPLVGVSFFPKAEKPQFRITVNLPNGSNLDATDAVVREVEAVLDEYEEVAYYASNVGHGNPRIYYNVPSTNYSNTFGEVFVILRQYDIEGFYALLDELRDRFAGHRQARIDVREFVQGPPSEAPVAIKIYGDDLAPLQDYARQVENIVRRTAGAINVDNPIRSNSTDLHFRINRDKAMMLGVPIHQIDKTIRSYVNGAVVGTYRDRDAEEYNLVLRYDYDERFRHEDFDKLTVQAVTGRFVPLKQLAAVEFEEAPSRITHLDQRRTATILADLDHGYQLDAVIGAIQEALDRIDWADGYSYVFKGDLENRNQSFGGMGIASLVALLLILGVLIVQFRSFSQPLIIFAALPLAFIGSILALLITGISFSFTAFIGLTSLIGIAINNSIVLVDFANKSREEGESVIEAAKQAGEVRFAPIVLTTLTTILGLLPLTLNGGSLWAPMGWTIIGGLLSSTLFVLLIVPLLYQLFTKDI